MSIVEKAIARLRTATPEVPVAVVEPRRRIEGTRPFSGLRRAPVAPTNDRVAAGPPLEIDLDALRRQGMLPSAEMEAQLANDYRRIKWPLLTRAFGAEDERVADGNLVMVTSALAGDGKTFTSFNLALAIARERDSSVLLIDADIAKAHVSEALGVRQRRGLTDLLLNPETDPADTILATSVDGVRVMPAGGRTEHGPELFASHRMRALVADIAARNPDRIIIFDSSPLLATNESQVLGKLVGQVVVVVRSLGTPRQALTEALTHVDRSRSVSLVLNQARPLFGVHNYSYYHYGSAGQKT